MLLCSLLAVILVCKADQKMPKKVQVTFEKQYVDAKEVNWNYIDDDINISFKHDGALKTAIFQSDGSWVKTVITIDPEMISACIVEKVSDDYFDAEFGLVQLLETPEKANYEVNISFEDIETEKKVSLTLLFAKNCSFLGEKSSGN